MKKNLFHTVMEANSLRSECQHRQVRAVFEDTDSYCHLYMAQEARELCVVFSSRALIAFIRVPPS